MIENLGSNGVEKLEYLGNKGSPPDSLETRCQDDTEIKKMNLTKLLILQPQGTILSHLFIPPKDCTWTSMLKAC